MRWGRFVGHKCELEKVDDPVHHGIVCEEGNDAHLSLAFGTGQGINFEHFFFDDGPEEAILLLEVGLVFCQKAVEIMEKHAVENSTFWMSGAVDSCHGQDRNPRNGPGLWGMS